MKTTTYGGHIGHNIPEPNGENVKVETFNGNIVLVPQYVFHILGNLDYRYRHGHGDLDYGYRAGNAGIINIQIGQHLGLCDRHERLSNWCNPDVPLKKRLKALDNPTQYDPKELFYFENKHCGFISACFHFITAYVRCLFPQLWVVLGKAKI